MKSRDKSYYGSDKYYQDRHDIRTDGTFTHKEILFGDHVLYSWECTYNQQGYTIPSKPFNYTYKWEHSKQEWIYKELVKRGLIT